jgi:arginine exporter protein ArgO
VWGGVPVGVLLLLLLLILAVGTQNRCVMSQKLKKDASQVGGVSELVEFCPTLPSTG